jgi:ABC-type multidrug transport system fused ATPase/permease subunit
MPDNDRTFLDKLKITRGSIDGVKFIYGYLRPYRWSFLISLVALLFSSLSGLAFPWLTGKMVDAATSAARGEMGGLNQLALILMAALVVQAILSYIRTYFLSSASEHLLADIRYDIYSKIIRLPMSFHNRTRVGELTSRLTSDIGQLQMVMTTTASELLRQSVTLVGCIILVAYTSPRLTSLILIVVPLIVVMALVFGRMVRKKSRQVQDLYAGLNTIAEETLQGINVVKGYTAEKRESERYRKNLRDIISIALTLARVRGAFVAFIFFVLLSSITGVIWYGGHLVQEGSLTLGALTSFVLYAIFVGGAMGSFADLYGSLQSGLGASERVRELLLEPNESTVEEVSGLRLRGDVAMEDIRFAYASRPDAEVLKGLTFDVPAGSSIALVGPSGAGKSTIAGILMRFYEPTSGRLIVDGRDATEYSLIDFRSAIAIVPQDVLLFGGTIEENIAYGAPDASHESVRQAAAIANAADFIESFPDGYQTVVGERGVQLSGGQRQRIAIARAVIKNPSILILDEATSSLDSESESLVQEALDRVMKNRTTFIIAHRLSTIRNADRVAVIRNGAINEYGTYEDLIALGGMFARLVALQNRTGMDLIDEAAIPGTFPADDPDPGRES